MDIVRTSKGVKYASHLLDKGKGRRDWVDWFVLAGLDIDFPQSTEEVLEEVTEGSSDITEDETRQSIRRLFEAGYIEEAR